MIVLDTNVASELMRASPDAAVQRWADAQDPAALYATAISVAEIRYGLDRLPAGKRRDDMRAAACAVFAAFSDHILPFDTAAAIHYALLVTERDQAGLPIGAFDAQIAAICLAHGAPLATRNGKDFQQTGLVLIDPWTAVAQAPA